MRYCTCMHVCSTVYMYAFLFSKGAVALKLTMNPELNRTCLKEQNSQANSL